MFSKFNYDKRPETAAVRDAVKSGDTALAKSELLRFFKARSGGGTFPFRRIDGRDENYGAAVLPLRGILTGPNEFDTWQGEFTVTGGAYSAYATDVTAHVLSGAERVSFLLFAADGSGKPILVGTKEGNPEYAPYLEISYKSENAIKAMKIASAEDTYIDSSEPDTPHGGLPYMRVHERGGDGKAADAESARAYLTFPLNLPSGVISARLILHAACQTVPRTVLVIACGDTLWSEKSLTWQNVRGNIYSYGDVPNWNERIPYADSEYNNVISRFWFGRPMLYEYISYLSDPAAYNRSHPYAETYPGAAFADRLINLMTSFAKQCAPGTPRTLETGERLGRWVDITAVLLSHGAFDGREDDFCAITAFIIRECEYLCELDIEDDRLWWSNWRVPANAGFFKAAEFLPELADYDKFRTKAEHNLEYALDTLYNDDMSFREAAPSYALWCAELFGECCGIADRSGRPMSDKFRKKLIGAARYAANAFFPDGFDTNTGDSNHRDKMPSFRALAECLDDPIIKAYSSNDPTCKERLTALYPDSGSLYMRSGWNADDCVYMSFVCSPFDGHCHADSNQVLMYAYGQPLLVDSGRYCYGGEESRNDIYRTLRSAAAHNTVEAAGCGMASHSASAGAMRVWADNALFVCASCVQTGYPDTRHERNIIFFKTDGLPALVVDRIIGKKPRTYRQNWHFLPQSGVRLRLNTAITAFPEKANLAAANADSDADAAIRDGYFSADYGLAERSLYASFEKSGTDVKFSTVLLPLRQGEDTEISASDTALSNDAADIAVTGKNPMRFYLNTAFETPAPDTVKAAFLCRQPHMVYGMAVGSRLELDGIKLAESDDTVSVGVRLLDGTAYVYIDKEPSVLRLYAPNAERVVLNGTDASFERDNDAVILRANKRSDRAAE